MSKSTSVRSPEVFLSLLAHVPVEQGALVWKHVLVRKGLLSKWLYQAW